MTIHTPPTTQTTPSTAHDPAASGSREWFADKAVSYVLKPLSTSLAGALSLSPIAIAIAAALEDPVAFGAITAVGGAAGLVAHVTSHIDQTKPFSEGVMKTLGAFYRGQATAAGSAAWASRFAALDVSHRLAGDLGWSEDLAPVAEMLMHVAFVVAYTMAVADAVAATNVVSSGLQEGIARLADFGETPLHVPVLKDLGKAVTCVFSTSACTIGILDLSRHLQPGQQARSSYDFHDLVGQVSTSPMAVSSAMGFLCWTTAMCFFMKEGGTWQNLSDQIKGTAKAVEKAMGLKATAQGASDDGAAHAEAGANPAEKEAHTACTKLRYTLAEVAKTLKGSYVAVSGGAMDMGVKSPFANVANPLGDSKGAKALGVLARCGTSPLTGMAVFEVCQQQLISGAHDDHRGAQAALYVLALAGFTQYWVGLLMNWDILKTPAAIDQLNATPRTTSTEALRALMTIVGIFGVAYSFDSLFDEADASRHQSGQFLDATDAVHLMGAGLLGFGAQIFSLVAAGGTNPATTRSIESTMMGVAGIGAGALDGGAWGAGAAAAGMAAGQFLTLLNRSKEVNRTADARTQEAAAASNDDKAKTNRANAFAAAVKEAEKQLGGMSEADQDAQVAKCLHDLNLGMRFRRTLTPEQLMEALANLSTEDRASFRTLFVDDSGENKFSPGAILSSTAEVSSSSSSSTFASSSSSSSSSSRATETKGPGQVGSQTTFHLPTEATEQMAATLESRATVTTQQIQPVQKQAQPQTYARAAKSIVEGRVTREQVINGTLLSDKQVVQLDEAIRLASEWPSSE